MSIKEYIKNKIILENFAYAYMYLPSYINLEEITSVTNNWQVLNVASSQSIIQNKDQTTYMFHFYSLDDVKDFLAQFVYEKDLLKKFKCEYMDIYGISSQFTVDFLENNVVKVKKEKSNNDFKRIKVEQYFQNGQIVSAKVWKNDSLQYSCYVNGELVYFDEKGVSQKFRVREVDPSLFRELDFLIGNHYYEVLPLDYKSNRSFQRECNDVYKRIKKMGQKKTSPN